MKAMKGLFITFEGGEGCGKSTQVARLAEKLREMGRDVVLTREPGGTELGEKIRMLLKAPTGEPPCDRSEVLLFLAARAQLLDHVIRPALARGACIISDRFSDSTFAYQGYGRGFSLELLHQMNAFACHSLVPHLTFLLEVAPEVAAARMRKRETESATCADRIERAGSEFHQRLSKGFHELALAEPDRFRIIDASGTPDEVFDQIWTLTKPFIS